MRALIQRVSEAGVEVDDEVVGRIGPGLLVLLGIGATDAQTDVAPMAGKIANLRIFPDQHGRFNRSLLYTGGAALLVSQFTLYADTRKGRRPSFVHAAPPELAAPLVEQVAEALRGLGVPVALGRFGAKMRVALVNDGPVTIWLSDD